VPNPKPGKSDPKRTLNELIRESEALREKSTGIIKRLKQLSSEILERKDKVADAKARRKRE
jgi:hypothetical protein